VSEDKRPLIIDTEGVWIPWNGGRKWHYMVGTRSLCRKWGSFSTAGYKPASDFEKPSPDDCKECRRRYEARKAKGG
jgi:hypothetical protein